MHRNVSGEETELVTRVRVVLSKINLLVSVQAKESATEAHCNCLTTNINDEKGIVVI